MAMPIMIEQSRAIPIELQRAFDMTLSIPLTMIFTRRYGLLPPIKQVRGQEGIWSHAGQSRTVLTTDGGTMREQLTDIDAPHSFSYRLTDITGPMRPLVHSIDGRWEFAPQGTGTMITWRWTLYPKSLGVPVMRVFALMWRGYARQAMELLSEQLLTPKSVGHTPD